jgi:hypothetical protein
LKNVNGVDAGVEKTSSSDVVLFLGVVNEVTAEFVVVVVSGVGVVNVSNKLVVEFVAVVVSNVVGVASEVVTKEFEPVVEFVAVVVSNVVGVDELVIEFVAVIGSNVVGVASEVVTKEFEPIDDGCCVPRLLNSSGIFLLEILDSLLFL